jgi:hypothetical protein
LAKLQKCDIKIKFNMKILIAIVGIPKQFLKQKFLEFLLLSSEGSSYCCILLFFRTSQLSICIMYLFNFNFVSGLRQVGDFLHWNIVIGVEPYLTSVSSTPFQGEPPYCVCRTVPLFTVLCTSIPPPLSITTNYKILCTLIL